MNFILSFTNKYINILITSAVAIAFPVLILDSISLPNSPSIPPLLAFSKIFINELFINNKNLTKNGASAIATPPKHQS